MFSPNNTIEMKAQSWLPSQQKTLSELHFVNICHNCGSKIGNITILGVKSTKH